MRRAGLVALVSLLGSALGAPPAGADKPSVRDDLLAAAERTAAGRSARSLAALAEEEAISGDATHLAGMLAAAEAELDADPIELGWLAAAYGVIGDKAAVDRLAKRADEAIAKITAKESSLGIARCALAVGYEHLDDEVDAETQRAAASGNLLACAQLATIAARAGRHDRVRALIDVETPAGKLERLVDVAAIYAPSDRERAREALTEATALLDELGDAGTTERVVSRLSLAWTAIGERAQARAAARRALAMAERDAARTEFFITITSHELPAALAAAGEKKALAKLVKRVHAVRAAGEDPRRKLYDALFVAHAGRVKEARKRLAAAASIADKESNPELEPYLHLQLASAHLAIGDLAHAIEQATRAVPLPPPARDMLIEIAAHCRLHPAACKRTRAVDKALAALARHLDRIEKN